MSRVRIWLPAFQVECSQCRPGGATMLGLALVGGVILGLHLRIGLMLTVAAAFIPLQFGLQLVDDPALAAIEAWLFAAILQAVALSVAIIKDIVSAAYRG